MFRFGRAVLFAIALVGCAGEDDSAGTLDTLDPASASDAPATTFAGHTEAATSTAPSAESAGEGSVSLRLRFAASGLEETIALDLASVAADDLDPISLFASCTGLTEDAGTEGFTVNVTDLRRLTSDRNLVAVELTVEGPVDRPGEYQATLDVDDATQTSTSYSGTVTLERGLRSGRFDVTDPSGNAATGSFTCEPGPPPATTGVTTGSVIRRPDVTAGSSAPTTRPVTTNPAPSLTVVDTSVASTVDR